MILPRPTQSARRPSVLVLRRAPSTHLERVRGRDQRDGRRVRAVRRKEPQSYVTPRTRTYARTNASPPTDGVLHTYLACVVCPTGMPGPRLLLEMLRDLSVVRDAAEYPDIASNLLTGRRQPCAQWGAQESPPARMQSSIIRPGPAGPGFAAAVPPSPQIRNFPSGSAEADSRRTLWRHA